MEIENIIFDFGGVILDIDPKLTVSEFQKLGCKDVEKLQSEAFYQEIILKFEKGLLTPNEFRSRIREFLNMDFTDAQIDHAWNTLLSTLKKERIQTLEAAKKHYALYMLSNSNAIHYDFFVKDLKDHFGYEDFDALFRKAYFSFRLHMHKPNTDIYHYVIRQENIVPEKTLFIDDRADNIEGARKAGLKTYHLNLQKGQSMTALFNKEGLLLENLEIV
ncbi:MAG: HAD family phosphatase [Bacteroidales bacterium]|nr:HAD family phosphatase [Bacteroidales bacterium]